MSSKRGWLWTGLFGMVAMMTYLNVSDADAGVSSGSPVKGQDLATEEEERAQRERYRAWVNAIRDMYATGGVASGKAEFHLLRPWSDPQQRELISRDSNLESMWYDWVNVLPRYELGYHYPPALQIAAPNAEVGLGELFTLRAVTDAQLVADGTGTFRVEIYFSAPAVDYMQTLVQSREGYSQLDWFGVPYDAQGGATEMEAVLVADGVAYTPFSVTDIVSQSLVGVPVIVATELDAGEAQALVDLIDP